MGHLSSIAGPMLVGLGAAASATAQVVETRTLEETIDVADAVTPIVEVDNVFGSIRVSGHDRATVELTANETVRADTRADLERARDELGLRVERDGNRVRLRVGPSDDSDRECDCRWRRWDASIVAYDFDLHVPRTATLELATVNDGEIFVVDVDGDYAIRNVNGPVTLNGLTGSGTIETVNGGLDVVFERAPLEPVRIETVNGPINVTLPADASADIELDSGHGRVWTDFDIEPLATAPVQERRDTDGMLVIRSARTGRVRIGAGGPIHSLSTLNGDIHVRKTSHD